MDMRLHEVSRLALSSRESRCGFEDFRHRAEVLALRWPDDVLEQWLYDHPENSSFLRDYGSVELSLIRWRVEVVGLDDLLTMPTGPSDDNCMDEYAGNPNHWIRARRDGIHMGVAESWETHGTWKRWPILLDRSLLDRPNTGLQVVEGRTRVGVLRGRYRDGSFVAVRHLAWVGRSDPTAEA